MNLQGHSGYITSLGLGRQSEYLARPPATMCYIAVDGFILVTPERPDHLFGNVWVFPEPEGPSALRRRAHRAKGLGIALGMSQDPALAWESSKSLKVPSWVQSEASALGYDVEVAQVMTLDPDSLPIQDERDHAKVKMRLATTDADWISVQAMPGIQDTFGGHRDLRSWFLSERRKIVQTGQGQLWVAEHQSSIVAACFVFRDRQLVRLDQLIVHPRMRNRGLGSYVISELSKGFSDCIVVMEPTAGSWRSAMYYKVGYRPVGVAVTLFAST